MAASVQSSVNSDAAFVGLDQACCMHSYSLLCCFALGNDGDPKALSAIAQLPRPQLQSTFLASFARFLDLLPCLRKAVAAFCRGDYRSTFAVRSVRLLCVHACASRPRLTPERVVCPSWRLSRRVLSTRRSSALLLSQPPLCCKSILMQVRE